MASPANSRWWTDESDPHSYRISDPDRLYDEEYFNSVHHPNEETAINLYEYMQEEFKNIAGREFTSALEIGTGSGELAVILDKNMKDYKAIEPTNAGIGKLLSKGIDGLKIFKNDIRFMNTTHISAFPAYDLAICTEVAEHIEPWFACKVVEVCTSFSRAVWFSAAKGNYEPHYDHPNEAPIGAWDTFFSKYGFGWAKVLDGRFDRADRLYYYEA